MKHYHRGYFGRTTVYESYDEPRRPEEPMSHEFDAKTLELVQRGTTAALLLDAQRELVGAQVEKVLMKIDHVVVNGLMDANMAVGLVHEIAAFRRILSAQKQIVEQGRRAQLSEVK